MQKAVLFVVLALLGIGIVWWAISRDPESPDPDAVPPAPELTVEELQLLIQRKNLAVAQLENSQLREGDPAMLADGIAELERLAEEWPGELVAVQNLAIARFLQIEDAGSPADRLAAISRARMAIQKLIDLAPSSEVPYVLSGRLAVVADDPERALEQFATAAAMNSENAATWYEVRTAWNEFEPTVPERIRNGIERSHQLAPDNLWVLRDLWTIQLTDQDPRIVDTLESLHLILEMHAPRIREVYGYDVLEMLHTAQQQAAGDDWTALRNSLAPLWNVIKADDAAQSDQRVVDRHVLEFVVLDFSDEFYESAPELPDPGDQDATPDFQLVDGAFSGFDAGEVRDVALEDFDLDQRLDLCLLREGSVVVVGRGPDAEGWSPITSADIPGDWHGLLLVDVDDDRGEAISATDGHSGSVPCHRSDLDVVLFGDSGLTVLLNVKDQESGRRSLVSTEAFDDAALPGAVNSCLPVDADMDGDLDLLVSDAEGVQLLSNRGNASFRVREESILDLPAGFVMESAAAVDFDRDVDIDVLVATAEGTVGMLENLRHGYLRWRAMPEWQPAGDEASSIEVVESDGNVSWDVLAGSPGLLALHRTRTVARGDVQQSGTHTVEIDASRLAVADFDNDSLDEVLCWSDEHVTLVDCALDGGLAAESGVDMQPPSGERIVTTDYGDLDGDGDLDLVVLTEQGVRLFDNSLDPPAAWIDVQLVASQRDENRGIGSGRVNHYGLGSLIEMRIGGAYRAKVVRRPRTHFGLDSLGDADVLRVVWTNGIPQNLFQPESNQAICEVQAPASSCPYLYAWNGERHVFVTDLCWAAPLGLPSPQGGLVPHRDWEYVKIDGRLLAEQDGNYRLQVTEELWEATYFDQVRLVAIDHPADVSIYSNEKVGPAELSQYMIHTVREPRRPIAARDHRDRDVLPEIAAKDDVYLRLHDDRITQGYTQETYLELDLGHLDHPDQIKLFLTGWLYPTDANLNAALAENPDLSGPQPPSIRVPSASGEWIEAIPSMGFPGGKTKTIAVDISDIFPTDDYRVRIVTSMELCWDHIFFTVNESPVEFIELDLELVSADLHDRGVSEFTPHPHHGPDRYHYDRVTSPKFSPMSGSFTRFGDVRELITTADDLLLVMGCGDECTLEFAVPPEPLPEGWTRDFILHSVGWDKDANMNTVYGQTVEPMPYRNMESYPYPPDSFPGSPEYDEYLRTYQTRTFDDGSFRRAIQ